MSTLFASFRDPANAEKAAGALLDHGARPEDISIVANESYAGVRAAIPPPAPREDYRAERDAKSGISTTTPADVASGAAKGTVAGFGLGIVAAFASLAVPGVGLVLGGAALALAASGAVGAGIAGAVAGGIAGYLKDQGLTEDVVTHYSTTINEGGSILAIAIPSGDLVAEEAEQYVAKYGASHVAISNSTRAFLGHPVVMEKQPVVLTNPNIDPVEVIEPVPVAPPVVQSTTVVDAATGETHQVRVPLDPATGVPLSQGVPPDEVLMDNEVRTADGVRKAIPAGSEVRGTQVDPVTGRVVEGYYRDPATGDEILVRWFEGRFVVASPADNVRLL